ncbi:MAG TPA: hypothetical protein VI279_07385 [Rhodocyclaceae bacterium]
MPAIASEAEIPGKRLAVLAESLFLANLLLLPGIPFALLAWLWWRHRSSAPLLARRHLRQTTFVSLYGGILIVSLSTLFIALGGLRWEWTWVLVIVYFVCVHATLVMFGLYGLARAMAGQAFRYPWIGPTED